MAEVHKLPWENQGLMLMLGCWVTAHSMETVDHTAVEVKQHCWDCSLTKVSLVVEVHKLPWENLGCLVMLGCLD